MQNHLNSVSTKPAAGHTDQSANTINFNVAAAVDLANLSTIGFKIQGTAAGDRAGDSVSSAGDVNGDGFDDLIVGAKYAAKPGAGFAGAAYVIFGGATLSLTDIDLGNLTGKGFKLQGAAISDLAGFSVSSTGDLNGDGFDDLIVGAKYADIGGKDRGAAYVIFGGVTANLGNIDLGTMTAAQGFKIQGALAGDKAGHSVSSAGDVNGDGFDDMIVGAVKSGGSGAAYVIFGKGTGFSDIDLGTMTTAQGFKIEVTVSFSDVGPSVSSAGDVNGDGFDDLIIGQRYADKTLNGDEGAACVIFGKGGGFGLIDPVTITAAQGFKIQGAAAGDRAGFSVSSAGDFNGDGFDDLIVGAPNADKTVNGNQGAAYVIFGKAIGLGTIDLTALTAAQGFKILQALMLMIGLATASHRQAMSMAMILTM